ncbi:hypothetical protein GCM10007172_28710 [Sinomonas atrocyanea]|nr:hypothetical protein GCM10007172_28710 [Sinomonas atrocyanea]
MTAKGGTCERDEAAKRGLMRSSLSHVAHREVRPPGSGGAAGQAWLRRG